MPGKIKPDIESTEINLNDPALFINREISALTYQRRILEEAKDEGNPLLERVKFLSILGSYLDEFFMVRVSGLKKQVDAGVLELPPDGMTPAEQLAAIRKIALEVRKKAQDCLIKEILPKLDANGIHILEYKDLNDNQISSVKFYFEKVVFPVLTPLAFDPGHPFPHISNLSLNLAVLIRDKQRREHFARIKVPSTLPRFVPIKRSSGGVRKDGTVPYNHFFTWLEQVIAANLDALFPGMEIREVHPFCVVRDADMSIQELEADDLLESMEQTVKQRRFGSVVRLTINNAMPDHIRAILIDNLELDRNDIYVLDGPLGLSSVMGLYEIDRHDLKDPPYKPAIHPIFKDDSYDGNIFNLIRQKDILFHHPYDSFIPIIDFLKAAAKDPDVLAIKQTLYRVGKQPPVVETLLEAVENGKQVAVLVELKARFDEESNIGWARMLEREGVHVVYGLLGLKTHSKIALVVRKEGDGIRRYLHLATGNYNVITAQVYEDIGLFTSVEEFGEDATDLFNYLTGYSTKNNYRKLLVAPINLRQRMVQLIEREIEHQTRGEEGHLIFKVNSLVDKHMIQMLYKASQAGVKVDLLVRGICCLRPGLPKISENIRIISIIGRYLEHSRIYYFRNGGNREIFIGSADLMPRNIDRRVEVLFPIENKDLVNHIHANILSIYFRDNIKARLMKSNGEYERVQINTGDHALNIQEWLMKQRSPE
jgi:polyphosphate kinase